MHGQSRTPSCLHLAHAEMYNSDTKPTGYCKWNKYSHFLFEGEKLKLNPTWAGDWLVSDFTEPHLCLLAADGQRSSCPIFEKFWWRFMLSEKLDKLCAAFNRYVVGKEGRRLALSVLLWLKLKVWSVFLGEISRHDFCKEFQTETWKLRHVA